MARTTRTHVGPDSLTTNLTPKHLTKQEFGQRLYDLMLSKGWNQSELARHADLPRDSISVYLRGKSLPTPKSLVGLSKALGVPPNELLPNMMESAIQNDFPAFEMKISPNAPQMAWVRINRAVPTNIALKIAGLIGEADNDDTPH
jgi:transcriptional regulator with XRE-family HTH domain